MPGPKLPFGKKAAPASAADVSADAKKALEQVDAKKAGAMAMGLLTPIVIMAVFNKRQEIESQIAAGMSQAKGRGLSGDELKAEMTRLKEAAKADSADEASPAAELPMLKPMISMELAAAGLSPANAAKVHAVFEKIRVPKAAVPAVAGGISALLKAIKEGKIPKPELARFVVVMLFATSAVPKVEMDFTDCFPPPPPSDADEKTAEALMPAKPPKMTLPPADVLKAEVAFATEVATQLKVDTAIIDVLMEMMELSIQMQALSIKMQALKPPTA